jgi:hypothetical protein
MRGAQVPFASRSAGAAALTPLAPAANNGDNRAAGISTVSLAQSSARRAVCFSTEFEQCPSDSSNALGSFN